MWKIIIFIRRKEDLSAQYSFLRGGGGGEAVERVGGGYHVGAGGADHPRILKKYGWIMTEIFLK